MLEFIRNNVGGLLGILIIGALATVFTISFGPQNQGWGEKSGDDTAISVSGSDISMATLNYAISLNTTQEMAADSPEYAALRQQVVMGLIERELLLQAAEAAGVSASSDEAMEKIIKGEYYITRPMSALASQLGFRIEYGGLTPDAVRTAIVRDGHRAMLGRFVDPKGKFDAKSFNRTVRYRLNFKEDAFIEQQRLELIAQRMRGLLVSGVTVSPEELRDAYNRDNDTVSLSYIRLAPESFDAALDTSDAAISAWAAANGDAVRQYYETNKYKYTNVEKSARARHILIKVAKDAPDADRTAARGRIDGLLARAKAGEDFAALATANSEDEGSAKKGGDLGYNPRGVMVPEFDEAMFALSPGQVSSVVETEFGYHIIKLESFREGTVSLEDATPEIAARIYAEKEGAALARKTAEALQAALNAGRNISELLAAAPVEEDTAAATDAAPEAVPVVAIPGGVSLSVQETAAFPRNAAFIPGIGASRDMADAAFSLTAEKPSADRVFEVDGNWFVVALKERKTPSDEDFAAKKEDIEGRLLAAKIITWMQDRISAMVDSAVAEGRVDAIVPIAARGQAAAPAPAKKASGTSDNSDG